MWYEVGHLKHLANVAAAAEQAVGHRTRHTRERFRKER